jgi:hypothetical protein
MKIFVDDVRPCPDGWMLARTIEDAKAYLMRDDITEVSLDHDMGACVSCVEKGEHVGDMVTPETTYYNHCPHAEDGYTLVMWMIENNHIPPIVRIHSMNSVGVRRMVAALESRNVR